MKALSFVNRGSCPIDLSMRTSYGVSLNDGQDFIPSCQFISVLAKWTSTRSVSTLHANSRGSWTTYTRLDYSGPRRIQLVGTQGHMCALYITNITMFPINSPIASRNRREVPNWREPGLVRVSHRVPDAI